MAHLLRVPEIAAGTTEAVLATWPELQERARFPLPSTGLLTAAASSGSASLTGAAVASRRGRLSSAEHVPVASEGLR